MEFKELIQTRRSVRAFADEAVPHEVIEEIVKEAQMAPSWKNLEVARMYVVESPEKLEAFRTAALPEYNRANSEHAALIVTTYVTGEVGFREGTPVDDLGNEWGAYDLGLHDAYLILSARDHGYDTLIMGLRNVPVIRKELGIPENERIVSVIALGKRAKEPVLRPRRAMEEVVKFF